MTAKQTQHMMICLITFFVKMLPISSGLCPHVPPVPLPCTNDGPQTAHCSEDPRYIRVCAYLNEQNSHPEK